jgi:hypothetical protein
MEYKLSIPNNKWDKSEVPHDLDVLGHPIAHLDPSYPLDRSLVPNDLNIPRRLICRSNPCTLVNWARREPIYWMHWVAMRHCVTSQLVPGSEASVDPESQRLAAGRAHNSGRRDGVG